MKSYLLDENKNPYVVSFDEFQKVWADDMKRVAIDYIDNIKISTVFLGWDHSFMEESTPILFETMIFGGEYDEFQRRYETYNEALQGHTEAVEMVKQSFTPKTTDNGNI
jgi:hypothetical protein